MNNLKEYIVEKFKITSKSNNSEYKTKIINRILDIVIEKDVKVGKLNELENVLNTWLTENKIESLFFYYDNEEDTRFSKKEDYFITNNPHLVVYYSNEIHPHNKKLLYIDMNYTFWTQIKQTENCFIVEVITPKRRFIIIGNE